MKTNPKMELHPATEAFRKRESNSMSELHQIGYHLVGGFTEAECNQYFGLLNDTKPACITVLGAAQFDQALRFAKTCKQVYPDMRVIYRHFINKTNPRAMTSFEPQAEDTGRHKRMSADWWWEAVGKLYIGTGLTVLPDNESTMEDYTPYAAWMAKVMELAGNVGVPIAYGRFPAFHPAKGKEQQLDAMLKAAFKYPIHTYSPNVYWSADNLDAFKYPRAVIDYARKLGITLDTTIGEFALLRDVRDAHHGWRSANVSGKVYALDMVIKAKVHLPGIPVCAYSIGQWPIGSDTFSLDKDALDTIKATLTPLDKPIAIDPTPTVPLPPLPPIPDPTKPPQTPPPIVILPPPVPPPAPPKADTVCIERSLVEDLVKDLDAQIADCEARLATLKAKREKYQKSLDIAA